nr:MAG TPA: hypothetical protein [Caudoviricetes sp.]
MRLDEHGTATVTVPPTDNTFAYEVTIGDSADSWRFIRVVQVPDSANVLNFSDLVEVDSATLTPVNTGNPLADIDQSDVDWALSTINA